MTIIAMMACTNDIVTDGMEYNNVKTLARRKILSDGEHNEGGLSEEEDTCKYYVWEALDTTVIEHIGTYIDLQVNITCNGGFSSQLQPNAVYSTIVYEPSDSSSINIPVITPGNCELGNNGRIICYYYISGCIEYTSVFLHHKIETVP